jgi:F-type H+-transporting ATPase subunit c
MKKNLFAILALVLVAAPAFAQEASGSVQVQAAGTLGLIGIGIGIMMGLAVLGGTLGQSKAAAMALEGIARNPAASGKLTVPLILSLALMESLVLFAFLIGLFLQGSVSSVLGLVK